MGRHSGAVLDAPAPEPPASVQRTWGDNVRLAMRGIGQTLITGGLVVLLFVFYEVYVTTWFTDREQTKLKHELAQTWQNGGGALTLPDGKIAQLKAGQGIANIYIPRLGRDFAWTIVEGTNEADLNKGPGHYIGTALPGAIGNFAIAGHRVGKGEPFLNLDHLKAGDDVIIQTATNWFVYTIKGANGNLHAKDPDGIPGSEIITPSEGRVLDAVPDHNGLAPADASPPNERLLTMTTCHPKFTATHRLVYYGVLDTSPALAQAEATHSPKDQTMPAAISALYNGVT